MSENNIEKLDKKRYKFMFWRTLGATALIAGFIIEQFTLGNIGYAIACFLSGFGVGLFTVAAIKYANLQRKIKADKVLDRALNDEIFKQYEYKALRWGFNTTMLSALAIGITSAHVDIKTSTACILILFLGSVGIMVAQLIYYRR